MTSALGAPGTQVQTARLTDAVCAAWGGIDVPARKLAVMIAGP
ncbi:MAG: hypothetical protein ACRD3M_11600 [Thermoanaerobaculia bacterium]